MADLTEEQRAELWAAFAGGQHRDHWDGPADEHWTAGVDRMLSAVRPVIAAEALRAFADWNDNTRFAAPVPPSVFSTMLRERAADLEQEAGRGACPTCSGPQRRTTNMVCQTCGTDYAPEQLRDLSPPEFAAADALCLSAIDAGSVGEDASLFEFAESARAAVTGARPNMYREVAERVVEHAQTAAGPDVVRAAMVTAGWIRTWAAEAEQEADRG